jgi:transposase
VSRPVQQLLSGMPTQRRVLVAHQRDGQVLVTAGGVALVGPYRADDAGARNLGMVMLTQMGFGVGQVAEAFKLKPGTVSHLRTAFGRGGSAALVKTSGRPAALTEQVVAEVRQWLAAGASQQQAAARLGVTQSAISWALRRHPAPAAGPVAAELDFPDSDSDSDSDCGAGGSAGPAGPDVPGGGSPAAAGASTELVPRPAAQLVRPAAAAELVRPAAAGRVGTGSYPSRYAGAMLAHSYLDRVGAGEVFAGLGGAAWRRFDQAQVATFTVLALLSGVGSLEQVKALVRGQAGPLVGLRASPELHTLRGRLAGIADRADVLAVQRTLATAMLRTAGESAGIFYVDDHFVPYGGAKPVAMGHNSKRGRNEKGRADTLLTDARGRAVCFTTGEPSHLSKTMQPALRELRQIIPTGKILLGFDRGGAYAEAFGACRQADIDFLTYRRGALADTSAEPVAHRVRRGRGHTQVILADEQITFPGYDGPCRQLTLYERGCACPTLPGCPHLAAVLQVLTSDTTASAPDLLLALKGRWVIENAFKYLDFYGIDWLVDYHAEIAARTALVRNPARDAANAAIRAAKTELAEAQRTLGELIDADLSAAEKTAAIPGARAAVADTQQKIKTLTADRDTIPVELPANQIDPTAQRALQRAHRRGFVMVLRLLAYNTDTWLADHLNAYLQDPNEYRSITRSLMHTGGTITYTPDQITVTLDRPDTPRITRALVCLLHELNHTTPHLPGDPRPITYQIADP